MKFIGVYDYTVILTYMSLVSGLISMKCSYEGNLCLAMICLVISGICDMFDGVVARTKKNRTDDEKNFGIQLDSLCDVVCFGVVPAVYLYFSGVNTILGMAILVFYALCAVIRLAFFNVLEIKRQTTEGGCTKAYRGLPVTSASMIFPFLFLVGLVIPENVMVIVHYVAAFVTAILFIADFRVPKLDVGKLLSKKK